MISTASKPATAVTDCVWPLQRKTDRDDTCFASGLFSFNHSIPSDSIILLSSSPKAC